MPTDKGGKRAAPESIIRRFGGGWDVPSGLETVDKLTVREENKAEKTYIHVRSDVDNLVHHGRYYPK